MSVETGRRPGKANRREPGRFSEKISRILLGPPTEPKLDLARIEQARTTLSKVLGASEPIQVDDSNFYPFALVVGKAIDGLAQAIMPANSRSKGLSRQNPTPTEPYRHAGIEWVYPGDPNKKPNLVFTTNEYYTTEIPRNGEKPPLSIKLTLEEYDRQNPPKTIKVDINDTEVPFKLSHSSSGDSVKSKLNPDQYEALKSGLLRVGRIFRDIA